MSPPDFIESRRGRCKEIDDDDDDDDSLTVGFILVPRCEIRESEMTIRSGGTVFFNCSVGAKPLKNAVGVLDSDLRL